MTLKASFVKRIPLGAKDVKKDPLWNRNGRFDKPLHPSGICCYTISSYYSFNTWCTDIMTEHVKRIIIDDSDIEVYFARQGMILCRIVRSDSTIN